MTKQERAAIEAVVKRFSATREASGDTFNGYISVAGKRIAVYVTNVQQQLVDPPSPSKPRLRFDRVARGLIERLQDALRESVPHGTTAIVTITAPIRLPSKTATAIEDNIRAALAQASTQVQCNDTINGNRVRIRIVTSSSRQVSKVVGLVHNPDSDPDALLRATLTLLQHIGAAADRRTPAGSANERWLVIVTDNEAWPIETYRQLYDQLSIQTDFTKILMVFAGNRVETLTG